jgi:hypothetical protein
MISKALPAFWECFDKLPADIQAVARAKYELWSQDPFHTSLRFKLMRDDVWSVRVNKNYRALGIREKDVIFWFWIGTHREYERLVK